MPAQDDNNDQPTIRKAGPPPRSGREPVARAKGPVDPIDAEEVVASTEPDDDLSDYIVPPDPEPLPVPVDAVPPAPGSNNVGPQFPPDDPREGITLPPSSERGAGPITTADTELVHQLERELSAARARLSGQDANVSAWSAGPAPIEPKNGERVLIHVREDGFTANGRVWYRGQELEFTVGAANWLSTCDRYGKSWVVLSEADQIRRYGQVMFGHGPWPGDPFDNARAAEAERRRGREAPVIPQLTSAKPLSS